MLYFGIHGQVDASRPLHQYAKSSGELPFSSQIPIINLSSLPCIIHCFNFVNSVEYSDENSNLFPPSQSQKKGYPFRNIPLISLCDDAHVSYIMPPIPPMPGAAAGSSLLMFATTDSVVRKVEATLVAFCNALLVTLAGSTIPAATIST